MTVAGNLLVSAPTLLDPNFAHTVVLMIEHDDATGSLGVVLNRPTGVATSDAVPEWADVGDRPPDLYGGGPVEPQVAIGLGRTRVGVEPVPDPPVGPAAADAAADPDPDAGESGDRGDRPFGTGGVRIIDSVEIIDLDGDAALASARYEQVRIFSGYSGWGPGQLEFELDEGAWFVVEAAPDDVFTDQPEELWRDVLGRQGGALAQLRHFPDDVSLN